MVRAQVACKPVDAAPDRIWGAVAVGTSLLIETRVFAAGAGTATREGKGVLLRFRAPRGTVGRTWHWMLA
jgi:hypothetical protein